MRAARVAGSQPRSCISRLDQPSPAPNTNRPPLRSASVHAALATAIGCRCGRTSTDVPMRSERATAQTKAQTQTASYCGESGFQSIFPSLEYG